jgi:hypothetical protein
MVAIETTKCPQCDARVRNDAVRCPRCRHRLRTRRVDPVEAGLVGAILLLVGIGTAGMISGSDDPDTANASSGGSGVTVQGPTRDTAKARVSLKPPTIPTKVVLNDAKVAPIAATIRTHWTLRAKGDEPSLKQAFGLYTGQLVGAGEANWIRDIRKDGRLRIDRDRLPKPPDPVRHGGYRGRLADERLPRQDDRLPDHLARSHHVTMHAPWGRGPFEGHW